MVQPTVRERAMVQKDQQQVWDSVRGAISQMEMAAAASPPRLDIAAVQTAPTASSFGTTSYAKVMQASAVSEKVDEAAAPVMKSRDQVLAQLREEHAVGVIVAVRGEIVWADLFANTDLLSRYWTKLVRSYAAESLTEGETHSAPTLPTRSISSTRPPAALKPAKATSASTATASSNPTAPPPSSSSRCCPEPTTTSTSAK